MPFAQARVQFIKQGWQSVNVHAGEQYAYIGTERVLNGLNIDELESCAVNRPLCIFNYRRGKRGLQVVTHGEAVPDMRVEAWR